MNCYLTSRDQLDCDKDFFNKEFFKRWEDCPYEIRIIELATINQEEEVEEEDEEEVEPIELKQTIIYDECVICYENKPNVLYPDCFHISTCKRCEELHPINKCPMCREKVMIKYII